MQINLPQNLNQHNFTPVPNDYFNLMKRVADIFAARSGLRIYWDSIGYPAVVISSKYTLNGTLRTNLAWNTFEFFPPNFNVNTDETTLTAEQANFIIEKLLEICDINGSIYDHKISLNGSYAYTHTNSTLSDAKLAGVVPQFFEYSVIDDILTTLEREQMNYTGTSSCRTACTGLCTDFCGTSCTGICGGSCESSCIGSCAESCVTSCESTCSLACQSQCTGSCGNNCTNACSNMCNITCADSCSSDCTGECNNSCTGLCTRSCLNACSKTCSDACVTDCLGTCNDTCTGQCSSACTANCAQTCKDGCNKLCATTCTSDCTEICRASCGNSCIDGCGKTCGVDCTSACDGEANAYHPIDDTYVDNS